MDLFVVFNLLLYFVLVRVEWLGYRMVGILVEFIVNNLIVKLGFSLIN